MPSPASSAGPEVFSPKFDAQGYLTVVVTEADSGEVLMVAHMNQAALDATRKSKRATFFSRSRQALWVKGETSGNFLQVVEMRVDCDQDCLLLRVRLPKGGVACHTGERSCFFRKVEMTGAGNLSPIGS